MNSGEATTSVILWCLLYLPPSLWILHAGGFARLAGFNGGRHMFEICMLEADDARCAFLMPTPVSLVLTDAVCSHYAVLVKLLHLGKVTSPAACFS